MIAKVIQIGNSKGIRIPNQILKEMNIETQLELIISDKKDEIILKPLHKVRDGWNDSFKKMKSSDEDKLIIDDSLDLNEWEW
ncbi:MAG TPA: AbrB/MazE/SpoVT family DNA-binding domain-containing protein [Spirochaetota bacterium]|nr:AbrB/MazE/SpoVT family DNA-binding domain-containing protein [Spirochaetota bacterium]